MLNKSDMFLLIVCACFLVVKGSHFPEGTVLCHKSDPNFYQCLAKAVGPSLRSFANGSKYYGMPPMEPFFVKEMVLKGVPSNTVTIEQKYMNAYIHGMSKSSAERKFELDLEKCLWVMDVQTPEIRMEADYELTGKVLLFQLNGKGRCNVTLYNLMNLHTAHCEKYTKNGKTYLKLIDYSINMAPENVRFDFESLFPGNEMIEAEISKTINENSLAIFNDVKEGFEEIFSTLHMTVTNMLFSKEPLDEIFLD